MAVKLLPRFYVILGLLGLIGLNIGYYYLYKHNIHISPPKPSITTEVPLPTPKVTPKHIIKPTKSINCSYIKEHAAEYKAFLNEYSGTQLAVLKSCLGLK